MNLMILLLAVAGSYAILGDSFGDEKSDDSRLNKVEDLLMDQNERIRNLEEIVSNQKTEIHVLKDEMKKLKSREKNRAGKISTLMDILSKAKIPVPFANSGYMGESTTTILKKDVPLSTHHEKRLLQGAVAFYAYMNHTEVSPSTHHTIIFDIAITNENNGYHPYSGVFIVPVSGVYVFTFSIRVDCRGQGAFEIVKNDAVVGVVNAELHLTCIQDHIGATIVINANKGDDVYIRTHSTLHRTGDIVSDETGRSSFAGWLIS
ncbi:uncharacterized protein LOC134728070 [Mytilus trossulus]|uniref:uncharacterized protein LOC134728070 n=1 Tax=Mytilus trossulus TaxID=6551 RepID=UPI0030049898